MSELVKAIIRPPRAEYSLNDLGPSEFRYGGVDFVRSHLLPSPKPCLVEQFFIALFFPC